jgi:hypothetical protein
MPKKAATNNVKNPKGRPLTVAGLIKLYQLPGEPLAEMEVKTLMKVLLTMSKDEIFSLLNPDNAANPDKPDELAKIPVLAELVSSVLFTAAKSPRDFMALMDYLYRSTQERAELYPPNYYFYWKETPQPPGDMTEDTPFTVEE